MTFSTAESEARLTGARPCRSPVPPEVLVDRPSSWPDKTTAPWRRGEAPHNDQIQKVRPSTCAVLPANSTSGPGLGDADLEKPFY